MSLNSTLDGVEQRVESTLKLHSTYFLIEGIVLVLLGAAAIAVPLIATLAFTIFFGWLLLISGVVGLISTFSIRPAPGFWWSLLSAILALVVGFLLIAKPVSGAVSLTLLLVVFFVIEGFSSIVFASENRQSLPGRWGWLVTSGVVDIILAAMIFLQLPSSAVWAIGLLLGINLVFGGASLIVIALDAKKLLPPT
jgi:uncharacterized membrane protein HdeD (DUF308 family)